MNIIEALADRNLLGQFIEDPSTWRAWFAFLRAFFAIPPAEGDGETFGRCTGRTEWPQESAREGWVIAGRRSGKSFTVALLAAFLAVFREYRLSAGETGYVIIVSPTRQQSAIVKGYLSGFFRENAFLQALLARETREEIELNNRVTILVLPADFRTVRGHTAVACIVDEVAFLMDEGARPDHEALRALRPTLASTGGPLVCISSPYAKRGALFAAWQAHYGKDGDPVLVWQAPSLLMNPTLAAEAVERAREQDPEGAVAEWDALFRSDVESFVSRDVVESSIVAGRFELPPLPNIRYFAFVDPSGGVQDSYTLGIAFRDGEKAVLALLRERRPPFSPAEVTREYCDALKQYRCSSVIGDRYSAGWVAEEFRKNGIRYEPSSRSKSDIYAAFLGPLNSGRIELLDNPRLLQQLVGLERRTSRGGKDSIDHGPGGRDDLANSCTGALVEVSKPRIMPGMFTVGGNVRYPRSSHDVFDKARDL
jgi:hypothetical protein